MWKLDEIGTWMRLQYPQHELAPEIVDRFASL